MKSVKNITYGVIPARKNSKGLPKKNFRLMMGKPLIHYTCEEALTSGLKNVFLDTDDEEIVDYVKKQFPEIVVPYLRPEHLAEDRSQAIDVALHFLDWIKTSNFEFPEALCWLQPTSPLRKASDISSCLELMQKQQCSSVVSMTKVQGMNPYKMKRFVDGYMVDAFDNPFLVTNRQDLPVFYICNGAVFLTKTSTLLEDRSFYGKDCVPFFMSEELSINIDNEMDFILAELLMKRNYEVK